MPMTSPRFAGDPVLDGCRDGLLKMSQAANADGLAVKRVQVALIELGHPVGVKGADGFFGNDTAKAVVAYKLRKRLEPHDPVVGPLTSAALDDDFAVTGAQQDVDLGEFTEFVRARRVEPFVATELTVFQHAALDSWQHMLALFALDALRRDLSSALWSGSG